MKIKNRDLILILISILFIKLIFYFFLKNYTANYFGGGNDSNYYDAYALGYNDATVNIWAVILRFLADYGLYSREVISYVLAFLSMLVIPYMVARLAKVKGSPVKNNVFLLVFLTISIYPNLFYLSLDIYRDVFMVLVFLLGLFVFRELTFSNNTYIKVLLFLTGLAFVFILYKFRPYLGFGYLVALLLSWTYSFKRFPFYTSIILLILVLYLAYFLGLIDSILEYRNIFHTYMKGGSNIGILFDSNLTFGLDFVRSFVYQMMGFYFPNTVSVLAFITESILFIFALFYVIKNRKFSTKFVNYLIVFFVTYAVIWLLGNDNLGSATRLRMFNYIVIYIAAFIIYQNKLIFNKSGPIK